MGIVFLFILLVGSIAFMYWYWGRVMKKDEHYKKLGRYYDIDYMNVDVVRKFFKEHPDKLEEAERKYKVDEHKRYIREEEIKREFIKTRVFAYDYEEMLFQIFAQYEVKHEKPSMRDVIQRISEIKGIPENEAINMFMLLLNKKVLFDLPGDLGISLNPMLVTDDYWNKEWNIVSNTDMTLNKWMIAHGYGNKKD